MSGFEVRQRAALKGERGAGKGKRGGCWSNDSCVFLNCKCHYYFFFFLSNFFQICIKMLSLSRSFISDTFFANVTFPLGPDKSGYKVNIFLISPQKTYVVGTH